ncbi:MAG: glycoside hydrolase family 3 C-terminal domain-containing protein [Clostridiales bacterium]|jgi:beta-glucosidase|nr:glycoside hydrolase family 3 C-terminal domain-containing protein [Clostridiales bacterium]
MKNYKENYESFKKSAEELVAKMTVEEAASQLKYDSPAIERLGVPAYNWWNEALHGVARAGTATMFPQAIALAAMFDEDAIAEIGEIIAEEGRAKYNAQSKFGDRDIYKGLTFWSPNVNIFRDPRWGRGHETYGEDPYLTSRLGVAFVKALQGSGQYMKSAACAKHFAVHSGPESERHFFNAIASKRDLWDTYLPAFEACVTEADVESVMGAYNRTNDEPCCASKLLMRDILDKQWGFKGYYVSDCWAIRDFHTQHNVTATAPESAALALKTGCHLNCGNTYLHMMQAYNEGLVTEDDIRNAAVVLFTTRYKLGLFDENCEYNSIPYTANDTAENNEVSYKTSRNSIVLLKNNGILPLKNDSVKTIGVIGPNANNIGALIGNYFGTASNYVTNLGGIKEAAGGIRVLYSEGSHLFEDRLSNLATAGDRYAEAKAVAAEADVVILSLGLDASIEGEQGDTGNSFVGGDKVDLDFPACQKMLYDAVISMGKPVILVVNTGSAMNLKDADEKCAAVIMAWYSGPFGGRALADVIFGKSSPCAKLPLTFYESADDLPDFKDYSMENRTYRYFKGTPLYPFGFGLSFTEFEYKNLELCKTQIKAGEDLALKVTVKNAGGIDSDEIVQIYIKDMESGEILPNFSLCGFKRVNLKAGEEKTVEFTVKAASFNVVNSEGERYTEKGLFTLYAGGSQPDGRSKELMKKAPVSAVVEVI